MKAPLDRLTNWGGSVNCCHSWFTSSWETKLERCTLDTTRQVFQDSFSFSLAFCQSCNSSLNTFYDSNFMWVFRYPGRPRWSTRVNHEQNCCPVQLLGRQKRGTRTSCWSSLPWSWFWNPRFVARWNVSYLNGISLRIFARPTLFSHLTLKEDSKTNTFLLQSVEL